MTSPDRFNETSSQVNVEEERKGQQEYREQVKHAGEEAIKSFENLISASERMKNLLGTLKIFQQNIDESGIGLGIDEAKLIKKLSDETSDSLTRISRKIEDLGGQVW